MPDYEAILRHRLELAERMARFHRDQYERFKDTPRGAERESEAADGWWVEAQIIKNILLMGENGEDGS